MTSHVVCLAGDRGGAELIACTVQVLNAVAELSFEEHPIGVTDADTGGSPLDDGVLAACQAADAVILAPTLPDSDEPSMSQRAAHALQERLNLTVTAKPIKAFDLSVAALKPEDLEGTDLLIVSDIGSATPVREVRIGDGVSTTFAYPAERIEEAARLAFSSAHTLVSCLDKWHSTEMSMYWRSVVDEVHAQEFADVDVEYQDRLGPWALSPQHLDVMLTTEMFGDILWHHAVALFGPVGLFPCASLGAGGPGLFEPLPPSANRASGIASANPLAMFLSAAMMLRHGLGLADEAAAVESAVELALDAGLRTPDLGGSATTAQATEAVMSNLEQGAR